MYLYVFISDYSQIIKLLLWSTLYIYTYTHTYTYICKPFANEFWMYPHLERKVKPTCDLFPLICFHSSFDWHNISITKSLPVINTGLIITFDICTTSGDLAWHHYNVATYCFHSLYPCHEAWLPVLIFNMCQALSLWNPPMAIFSGITLRITTRLCGTSTKARAFHGKLFVNMCTCG